MSVLKGSNSQLGSMHHFVVYSLFLYSDSHFLFFSTISNFFPSFFFHYIISLQLLLSLSLVLIYILVTVVTWLWWLVPGLVAVRGESFWLGIDRPWTYCMRPCRGKGSPYADNTELMNTHTHLYKHIGCSGKVCKLKGVTGVVLNLIGFNNSSSTRRQNELTVRNFSLSILLQHPSIAVP